MRKIGGGSWRKQRGTRSKVKAQELFLHRSWPPWADGGWGRGCAGLTEAGSTAALLNAGPCSVLWASEAPQSATLGKCECPLATPASAAHLTPGARKPEVGGGQGTQEQFLGHSVGASGSVGRGNGATHSKWGEQWVRGKLKCAAHPSTLPAERPESRSQTWPPISPKASPSCAPQGVELGARHQRGRLPLLAWHVGRGSTTASFTARLRPVGRHQSPLLPGLSACAARTQLSRAW